MQVTNDEESNLVYKRPLTDDDRVRLGHEADVLLAVAHPGIVQLVRVEGVGDPDALILHRLAGGDLRNLHDQSAVAVASLGAALATTVADLHDLGVIHEAIEPSHVLLDHAGRPVLCSFGRARRSSGPSAPEARRRDVRALAEMLLEYLPASGPKRATRALRAAAGRSRRGGGDARQLARELALAVSAPQWPDGSDPTVTSATRQDRPEARSLPPRYRGSVPTLAGWGLAVGVLVVCVVVMMARSGSGGDSRSSPSSRLPETSAAGGQSASACPAADAGCVPILSPNGVLSNSVGRYQVGAPGDVIVVGRWRCGSEAVPAVLRPATGQVWTFDSWPVRAGSIVGRLEAQVPGAWTLRVRPGPSGCDELEVERRGLAPVTIGAAVP